MNRSELIEKIKARRVKLKITIENLAKLSDASFRTITRFFAGHNIKLDSLEKIMKVLGLDLAGNELESIEELMDKRAKQKALYIISLVQDTSSLEMQGLDENELNKLIQETKDKFLADEYKATLWAS